MNSITVQQGVSKWDSTLDQIVVCPKNRGTGSIPAVILHLETTVRDYFLFWKEGPEKKSV